MHFFGAFRTYLDLIYHVAPSKDVCNYSQGDMEVNVITIAGDGDCMFSSVAVAAGDGRFTGVTLRAASLIAGRD